MSGENKEIERWVQESKKPQWRDRGEIDVYFEKLNDILGHRPATQPEHLIDTSADIVESLGEPGTLPAVSDEEDCSLQEEISNTSREEEHDNESNNTKEAEESRDKQTRTNKKKKRPAKELMMEKVMDVVVSKVVKLHEESDSMMYAMEKKRMELDECLIEMEERHWQQQQEREDQYRKEQQDRDDQRRREERQFQMQMMQMMCGRPSFPLPQHLICMMLGPQGLVPLRKCTTGLMTILSNLYGV